MKISSLIRSLQRSINFQSRPSTIDVVGPAIGALAVGLLAGAGIALLLAPTSGNKLRETLESKIAGAKTRLLANGESSGSNNHRTNLPTSTLEHRS